MPPEHAAAIAEKMETLDVFDSVKTVDFQQALNSGHITVMGGETDEAFLSNVMAQATAFDTVRRVSDRFSMVYTPFHGTGVPSCAGSAPATGRSESLLCPGTDGD